MQAVRREHEIETGDLLPPPFDRLLGGKDVLACDPHAGNLDTRGAMRHQERDLGFVRAGFVNPMSAVPRLVDDCRCQPQETLIVQPIGIAGAAKDAWSIRRA